MENTIFQTYEENCCNLEDDSVNIKNKLITTYDELKKSIVRCRTICCRIDELELDRELLENNCIDLECRISVTGTHSHSQHILMSDMAINSLVTYSHYLKNSITKLSSEIAKHKNYIKAYTIENDILKLRLVGDYHGAAIKWRESFISFKERHDAVKSDFNTALRLCDLSHKGGSNVTEPSTIIIGNTISNIVAFNNELSVIYNKAIKEEIVKNYMVVHLRNKQISLENKYALLHKIDNVVLLELGVEREVLIIKYNQKKIELQNIQNEFNVAKDFFDKLKVEYFIKHEKDKLNLKKRIEELNQEGNYFQSDDKYEHVKIQKVSFEV